MLEMNGWVGGWMNELLPYALTSFEYALIKLLSGS